MGRLLGLLAWLACSTACVRDNLLACDDGRLCPSGTECDITHQTCVRPEQRDACDALVDGDVCVVDDGTRGICNQGLCVPGCGDAVHGAGEECDDGNFRSHDGCSSACLAESVSWHEWQPAWTGRTTHAAAYHSATQRLVIIAGANGEAIREDAWDRSTTGVWTQTDVPGPGRRRYPAMAYDAQRAVMVLFGGQDPADKDLGDTWEYDGNVWRHVTPTTSPAGRRGAAMVYDSARQRVVLFGGRTPSVAFGDTWEYDGVTWSRLTSAMAPSARSHVGMTYDTARQRVVMFGGGAFGMIDDTWELGPAGWTQTATTGPSARMAHAMAYFPDRGVTVMFGGLLGTSNKATDTWEYANPTTGWVQVTGGATTPPARQGATLTFDPGDTRLRLVGGSDAVAYDDVWEYLDDGTWQNRTPRFAPTPRSAPMVSDAANNQVLAFGGVSTGLATQVWLFDGMRWQLSGGQNIPLRFSHSATFDTTRQRAILFGGYELDFTAHDHTNEWDPAARTWTTFAGAKPPRRIGASLAYDASSRAVVMFGGGLTPTMLLNDTWEYDGIGWTEIVSETKPPAMSYAAMAHDPVHARTVLFGTDGNTWAYANRQWSRLELTTSPAGRLGSSMVFDPLRGRIVLFGGTDTVNAYYADAWELGDTEWRPLEVVGAVPPPRQSSGFAVLGTSLVLFGGGGSAGPLGDTWTLRYGSKTPDEDCMNGSDDDGDRQVDALDPDCPSAPVQ